MHVGLDVVVSGSTARQVTQMSGSMGVGYTMRFRRMTEIAMHPVVVAELYARNGKGYACYLHGRRGVVARASRSAEATGGWDVDWGTGIFRRTPL